MMGEFVTNYKTLLVYKHKQEFVSVIQDTPI